MVRSDLATSGVMFSIDTESGFEDVVFITAAYGLGETVVQGAVNPDEFYVHKPNLKAQRPAVLKRHLGSKMQKMIYRQRGRVTSKWTNHFLVDGPDLGPGPALTWGPKSWILGVWNYFPNLQETLFPTLWGQSNTT